MRLAFPVSPSRSPGLWLLGILWLSLAAVGCRPSARSVIDKHRATARQKLDLLRELAQAKDLCSEKAGRGGQDGVTPSSPPLAVPLVFAGDDEPAEKRARVNALAFQVDHYPRVDGKPHSKTLQILPPSRLVAEVEALLASGTFADGRKPTGAEAQALFDELGRLRYGALVATQHLPLKPLEVPSAALGVEMPGSDARVTVHSPGMVTAVVCLFELETRRPVAPVSGVFAANMSAASPAERARAEELLASSARFALFLRIGAQLPGTTVPCLKTRRMGITLDLCKPDDFATLPLLRVKPEKCDSLPCWQYVDALGRVVLPGPYKIATDFTEGLAMTGNKGQCAIIDRKGTARCQLACKQVLPATEGLFPVEGADDAWRYVDARCQEVAGPFSEVSAFNRGLARVSLMGGTQALINPKGAVTLFTDIIEVGAPSEGFLRVRTDREHQAFLTTEGLPAFEARRFLTAGDFSEGLAFVAEQGGDRGYIDTSGKRVLKLDADVSGGGPFRQGVARLNVGQFETRYIDREGKVLFTLEGAYVGDFSDGLAPLCRPPGTDCAEGFVDTKGQRVAPPALMSLDPFSEGLASFKREGGGPERGYVDPAFTPIIEPRFSRALPFSEGLAAVREDDAHWGFIDKRGQWVIPARYGMAFSFSGGLACVEDAESHAFFIDPKGEKKFDVPAGWRCQEGFSGGRVVLESVRNSQYLLVDTAGKPVALLGGLAPELGGEHRMLVQQGKVYGFLDEAAHPVIPPIYREAKPFEDGVALVGDERGAFFIDPSGKPLTDKTYIKAKPFREGLAPVAEGKWAHYSKGEQTFVWGVSRPVGFRVVPAEPFCDCKYALADKTGKRVTPAVFGDLEPPSQGLAAASFGSCRLVPDSQFAKTSAERLECSHTYGFVDTKGKLVIAPLFNRPVSFTEGGVLLEGEFALDREGNLIGSR